MNKHEHTVDKYPSKQDQDALDFANGVSFWKELWKEAKANWQTLSTEKKVGLTAISLAIAGATALGGRGASDIEPETGPAVSWATDEKGVVRYVDPVYGPEAPIPDDGADVVAETPALPGNDAQRLADSLREEPGNPEIDQPEDNAPQNNTPGHFEDPATKEAGVYEGSEAFANNDGQKSVETERNAAQLEG